MVFSFSAFEKLHELSHSYPHPDNEEPVRCRDDGSVPADGNQVCCDKKGSLHLPVNGFTVRPSELEEGSPH